MNTKTVEGVMIVKNGKAWARESSEHHGGSGYVNISEGQIYDERYVKKPSDVSHPGSLCASHLLGAEVVRVRCTINVELLPHEPNT